MHTRLPDSEILQLTGTDAATFAQAQFMNNVNALADGDWQWNGWLTPKGRLVAFFALARFDAQTFLVWLPAGGAASLASALRRYVFRAKVVITDNPAWHAIASFTPPAGGPDDLVIELAGTGGEGNGVDDGNGHSDHRFLWLSRADAGVAVDEALVQRWRLADLRLGVPYISPGLGNSEQFVPQWLSLERLQAFDLKKGCYPGQEIVARMHFLGQSKRAAFLITGDGDAPPPMQRIVDDTGATAGEVVWSQPGDSGWSALAVLSKDRQNGALRREGGWHIQVST